MLKLPVAEPLPLPGQLQVLAQLVEQDVGVAQHGRAGRGWQVAGGHQRIVHLHRQLGDVAAHDVTLFARPLHHVRQQPGQQFAGPGVHHHAVAGRQA